MRMAEPTRPLKAPRPLDHGGWEVESFMTSTEFTIRGLALIPSNSVVPVIVVPGIMGTNLRAKLHPKVSKDVDETNKMVAPGEPVWRPPNGKVEGWNVSSTWDDYSPKRRQLLLDGPTLEVDGSGPIFLPACQDEYVLTEEELRRRGWGEVHADSYGELLVALETRLNHSFGFDDHSQKSFVAQHWKEVMACKAQRWGVREFEPLTEAHLERHAQHYYPVYACGYNWLEDCGVSSQRLERRIVAIIDSWQKMKRRCEQVIIITHSMGGLVTRACAKRIPDKVAGVIHGVMPALGAPAAYRRMACGTEASSPSYDKMGQAKGALEKTKASRAAMILGTTTEKTTPVLAVSPGALELLPNHLYPGAWLHVRVMRALGPAHAPSYDVKGDSIRFKETPYDYLSLPNSTATNPYDLYRDTRRWYRLINPALVDPAGKFSGDRDGLEDAIKTAIDTAEKFHKELGTWYHPNTYAFYGDDPDKLSFGKVRWVARQEVGSRTALTAANVAGAEYFAHTPEGHRMVRVEGETELHFKPEPQDANGDATVPHQSGSGPAGKVKQVFATRGYDHQGAYHGDMLLLTLRLVAKIAQEVPVKEMS
jgi:pimeloyl-ACP methyl ester carboxylesterase